MNSRKTWKQQEDAANKQKRHRYGRRSQQTEETVGRTAERHRNNRKHTNNRKTP